MSVLEVNAEEAIDRNCRLMKLAWAEGEEIKLSPTRGGKYRIWHVPSSWIPRVGYMAALVR